MSYSDDYASPRASFSGDDTDYLDSADPIQDSPVTAERVVDTQSGFLVVIKRLESRLSLSVKRRIGTPPSSSILLTQDESFQLSRILSDGTSAPKDEPKTRKHNFARDIDNWLSSLTGGKEKREIHDDGPSELDAYNQLEQYDTVMEGGQERSPASRWDKFMTDEPGPEARRANRKRKKATGLPPGAKKLAIIVGSIVIVGGLAGVIFANMKPSENKAAIKKDVLAEAPLSDTRVDKFARAFVSNMLDFGPSSYRVSQIQAMAVMKPELLEKYWTETNFPLGKRQLSQLPQNQTVLITKVSQERLDETTKDVDIFAELVSADSKMSSPVHLKLKVLQTVDNQLQVIEQTDLTAGGHEQ